MFRLTIFQSVIKCKQYMEQNKQMGVLILFSRAKCVENYIQTNSYPNANFVIVLEKLS